FCPGLPRTSGGGRDQGSRPQLKGSEPLGPGADHGDESCDGTGRCQSPGHAPLRPLRHMNLSLCAVDPMSTRGVYRPTGAFRESGTAEVTPREDNHRLMLLRTQPRLWVGLMSRGPEF